MVRNDLRNVAIIAHVDHGLSLIHILRSSGTRTPITVSGSRVGIRRQMCIRDRCQTVPSAAAPFGRSAAR